MAIGDNALPTDIATTRKSVVFWGFRDVFHMSDATLAALGFAIVAATMTYCYTLTTLRQSNWGAGLLPRLSYFFRHSGPLDPVWNDATISLYNSALPGFEAISRRSLVWRKFPARDRLVNAWGLKRKIWIGPQSNRDESGRGDRTQVPRRRQTTVIRKPEKPPSHIKRITNLQLLRPTESQILILYGEYYMEVPQSDCPLKSFRSYRSRRFWQNVGALTLIGFALSLRLFLLALVPGVLIIALAITHVMGGRLTTEQQALFDAICKRADELECRARVFAEGCAEGEHIFPGVQDREIDVILMSSKAAMWCRCETRPSAGNTWLEPCIPTASVWCDTFTEGVTIAIHTLIPWGWVGSRQNFLYAATALGLEMIWKWTGLLMIPVAFTLTARGPIVHWWQDGDVWVWVWYIYIFQLISGTNIADIRR